jgi:hypothetical protein
METTKSKLENLSLAERKLTLQVFIDNYPKDKIHIFTHRIGKKKWELPTYEVPIELTYYSHKNSRIGYSSHFSFSRSTARFCHSNQTNAHSLQ